MIYGGIWAPTRVGEAEAASAPVITRKKKPHSRRGFTHKKQANKGKNNTPYNSRVVHGGSKRKKEGRKRSYRAIVWMTLRKNCFVYSSSSYMVGYRHFRVAGG